MPRKVTCQLIEWLDEGIIDPTALAKMCLSYMSEDDVADMAVDNDLSLSVWNDEELKSFEEETDQEQTDKVLRKSYRADTGGTSLQGYVTTTYADLVKAFGEPSHDGDGYKTDAEWELGADDGRVVTIYNWKDGPNYCGADGTPIKQITEWHIGGRSEEVVDLVQKALPTAKTRKGYL